MKTKHSLLGTILALFIAFSPTSEAAQIQKQGIVDATACAARGLSNANCLPGSSQVYDPTVGETLATALSNGDIPLGSGTSTSLFLTNLGIGVTNPTNTLVVALKQKNGVSDPSTGIAAVQMAFRNVTPTVGGWSIVSITSALSVTAASGASFGLVNGQSQYIYVYAQYNSGTPELCLSGSKVFDEGSVVSTTTISAGATSNSTLYCSTGRSSQPVRFLGRIQVNEATAGVYASAPTEISIYPKDIQQRSEVTVDSGNGFGSSNTACRRFSNIRKNIGSNITYADSATLGASFTINKTGLYYFRWHDANTSGGAIMGFVVNTPNGSTDASGLTYAQGTRAISSQSLNNPCEVTMTEFLNAGDVVTLQATGGLNSSSQTSMVTVIQLGD